MFGGASGFVTRTLAAVSSNARRCCAELHVGHLTMLGLFSFGIDQQLALLWAARGVPPGL